MSLVVVTYGVVLVLIMAMAGSLPVLHQLAPLGALLFSGIVAFVFKKYRRAGSAVEVSVGIAITGLLLGLSRSAGTAFHSFMIGAMAVFLVSCLHPAGVSSDRATIVILSLGGLVLIWANTLGETTSTYVAVATCVVALLAGLGAAERARFGRGSRPLSRADLMRLDWPKLALLWVTLLLISEIIPSVRNSDQMEPFRQDVGPVTGFTDRVNLNYFGELKNDDRRALIVRIRSGGVPWDADDYSRRPPFPMLMRGAVANSYRDGFLFDWPADTTLEPRPAFLDMEENFQTLSQDIVAAPHGGQHLFSLGYATDASVGLKVEQGFVRAVHSFNEATSYRVDSRVQRHSGRLALKSERIAHKEDRFRSRLPLRPEAQVLARDLWRQLGASTMYDRILALESWFQFGGNFRYSRRNGNDPDDPLSDFLVGHKAGPCSFFAVGMVAILREWGYPARVAMGFRDGTYSPANEALVFLQRNAHAWVEVPFHQSGWVSFDPTPPESRLDAISDAANLETGSLGDAAGVGDSLVTMSEKLEDPGFLQQYWPFLLLSFVLSFFAARMLRETLRSASAERRFLKEVEALDAWFRRQGVPRSKSQTFHEVAKILPSLNPPTATLLSGLLRLLDRMRYSGRVLSAEELAEFKLQLVQLTHAERTA